MRHPFQRYALAFVLAGTVAACGGNDATTPSSPAITETLSGTLTTSGTRTHTFAAGQGTVAITLASISPSGIYLGLAFGTWNGSQCTVAAVNETVLPGGGLLASLTAAATACVKVYDVGYMASGTTYTYSVQAVHY